MAGRPRLTEEEKLARKMERLQKKMEESAPAPHTPPPPGESPKSKNGGKGVDKQELASDIVRMARAGMRASRVDLNSPEAIMMRFNMYLDDCESRGLVPNMEGVYNWLGISRMTWNYIINRADGHVKSDEVVATLENIRDTMGEITSYAADAGLINTAIAVLKLTNTFGYRDVKQVEHHNEINVQIGTTDIKSLEQKYSTEQLIVDTELAEPAESDSEE